MKTEINKIAKNEKDIIILFFALVVLSGLGTSWLIKLITGSNEITLILGVLASFWFAHILKTVSDILEHQDWALFVSEKEAESELTKYKQKEKELKSKELILYMISELLHNEKDRAETFTENEVSTMLSKARVFTPYYGSEHPDQKSMDDFIYYLANEAWIKVFGKPAVQTDLKVAKWFRETV